MTEKSIEIARDRGLGTDDLLKYDVVPSSMLFDGDMLMSKPEKSQLIRNLEDKLEPDEYSYHHQPRALKTQEAEGGGSALYELHLSKGYTPKN